MYSIHSHHKRSAAAFGRGTSSVVSFVVAMNRVDVADLVVDLVDLDLDVDLVDVDLAVSLCDGPRSVLVAPPCFIKTELLCIVFTLGVGPKLVKLNLCGVFRVGLGLATFGFTSRLVSKACLNHAKIIAKSSQKHPQIISKSSLNHP